MARNEQPTKGKKPFCFESICVQEKGCSEIDENIWKNMGGRDLNYVMKLIERCGSQLQFWNKHSFGRVNQHLKKARFEMHLLQERHFHG